MKKWLIVVLGILVLGVIYLLISTLLYLSKENKIKKLDTGMTLEEFEKVLGEPPYEGKYCQVISAEKIKESIDQINSEYGDGVSCNVDTGECFPEGDPSRFNSIKELVQCFESYPNTLFVTYCDYNGNPFPILSEDNFRIYYNDQEIVCAIDRYGLGI